MHLGNNMSLHRANQHLQVQKVTTKTTTKPKKAIKLSMQRQRVNYNNCFPFILDYRRPVNHPKLLASSTGWNASPTTAGSPTIHPFIYNQHMHSSLQSPNKEKKPLRSLLLLQAVLSLSQLWPWKMCKIFLFHEQTMGPQRSVAVSDPCLLWLFNLKFTH